MNVKKLFLGLAFVFVALWVSHAASAAEKTKLTTIKIEGMRCEHCANKVAKQLQAVANVGQASVSAKTAAATVVPKDAKRLPSPRAQWEAVEKAGFKPVLLASPYGTFTSKPRF